VQGSHTRRVVLQFPATAGWGLIRPRVAAPGGGLRL